MPIRVRCRCGQEIVLRYGEWVYVFLGLVLLSVLVNMLVLLLLYLRMEELVRPGGGPQERAPRSSRAPETGPPEPSAEPADRRPSGSPKVAEPPESAETRGEVSSPAEPPTESAAALRAAPRTRPLRPPDPGDDPLGSLSVQGSAEGQGVKPRAASAEARDTVSAAPPPWEVVGKRVEAERPGGSDRNASRSAEGGGGAGPRVPWAEEPLLLRLELLENGETNGLPPEAFLLDPDSVIRRAAIERALARLRAGRRAENGALTRLWVDAARDTLRGDPKGAELLERLGGAASAGETPRGDDRRGRDLGTALETFGQHAEQVLSGPAVATLREESANLASQGLDVVVLLDVSRSMEPSLAHVQRALEWVLPAVSWGIPQSRVGLVLFRDDVERSVGLSSPVSQEVLQVLRAATASGGGNVPEGVHRAFRAALSLGRFDWRRDSQKHLIVVGDAPPPFRERRSVLLLARQASRQEGYRTHTVYFGRDGEFPEKEPFFPALARSGDGRVIVVGEPGCIGEELLGCLLPRSARKGAVDPLGGALRKLFSSS